MTHLNEIASAAFANSAAHGFWNDEPEDPQQRLHYLGNKLALVHGEVSEAHEELRAGGLQPGGIIIDRVAPGGKPEGLPSELADIVIRVADLAFRLGIDLEEAVAEKHAYNVTRPFKHGKKF